MLVIACPHALGLAIPLVVAIATERAARGGVLIKDRLALESMRTVDAVLFDKTGTLTKGEPAVTAVAAAPRASEDDVLALAAAAESDSEHPLARAIVDAARRARPDGAASIGLLVVAGRRGRPRRSTVVRSASAVRGCSRRPAWPSCPRPPPWHDEGAIVLHVLCDGDGPSSAR